MRLDANNLFDLLADSLGLGRGQVNLVQYRDHLKALLDRRIAVGNALGLDPLRSVHHQQRAFAGSQRAGHFVAEIDVSRRVDKIQHIGLAICGLEVERDALGLDGNAPLPFQIHGVEHLFRHFPVAESLAHLDKAISKRRLAVINMGDDGKITDVLHAGELPETVALEPGQRALYR